MFLLFVFCSHAPDYDVTRFKKKRALLYTDYYMIIHVVFHTVKKLVNKNDKLFITYYMLKKNQATKLKYKKVAFSNSV